MISDIIGHRKNGDALSDEEGYEESYNGNRTFKKTTVGWDLLIEWTDGTSTWVPLKDVKAGNPVELAE